MPTSYVCSIDTAINTINTFGMGNKFSVMKSFLKASVLGRYVYFQHIVQKLTIVTRNEYVYQVDRVRGQLVLIDSRSYLHDLSKPYFNSGLYQQSGVLSMRYQQHKVHDVILKIRAIGTSTLRAFTKGISSKETAFVIQNNTIYTCPPGCSYCIHPNICEICLPGFSFDQNKLCIKCGPNCADCDATDPQQCIHCADGFMPNPVNFDCDKYQSNCLVAYGTPLICISCKPGFYLYNCLCYSCIDNCLSCRQATQTTDPLCDVCIPGYAYNTETQTCVKCTTGCSLCNPQKIYQCIRCGEGFETTKVNNTLTCTKCPNNCKLCINGQCQVCRDDFRLMNNTCVAQCNLPCKQCSTTNGSLCTSCIGGFTFSGGLCTPDLACNSNSDCSFCPFGYNLVSGKCYQCQGGLNCRVCDNLNIETCISCKKGYFVNSEGTCETCKISGCADCEDQNRCLQCKPGFVLETSIFSKCLPCDSRCKICYENPSNCDTCAEGFIKQGWSCVNANNVNITLKITASLSSFTTQNRSSIEQTICETVGKDKKYFSIHQIKSGSIIIEGAIDADNTVQQNAMVASLQSLLASGSSIGGFPIQSVSLTANTGGNTQTLPQTQPQQQTQTVYVGDNGDSTYYRNIAIIVGVVIPIGLIIIFLVALVLYKKGIICQTNNDSKVRALEMDSVHIQENGKFK